MPAGQLKLGAWQARGGSAVHVCPEAVRHAADWHRTSAQRSAAWTAGQPLMHGAVASRGHDPGDAAAVQVLGKRLGRDVKPVGAAIRELSRDAIAAFERSGEVSLQGHTLRTGDIRVRPAAWFRSATQQGRADAGVGSGRPFRELLRDAIAAFERSGGVSLQGHPLRTGDTRVRRAELSLREFSCYAAVSVCLHLPGIC